MKAHSVALVCALAAPTAFASPPPVPATVMNPSFDAPWAGVPIGEAATTYAICAAWPGAVGNSASKYWTTYGNASSTSINSWIKDSPGRSLSNFVAAGGAGDGLVQILSDVSSGSPVPIGQCTRTNVNHVSAWIYVIAGGAYLEMGNGGSGSGLAAYTTTTEKWEHLETCARGDMWNNEIVIYGTGPAVFYADDVTADFSPDCLTCPHAQDTAGEALSPDCGFCEAEVCAVDIYCCTVAWDSTCVSEATACWDSCP